MEALSVQPGPDLASSGGRDMIHTSSVGHVLGTIIIAIIIVGEFQADPPGPRTGLRVEGARRPAPGPAPSQAPPRRRRFEVPIRQIESINYEGNNLAAPRGPAAERSRGIRPQIALSLPK